MKRPSRFAQISFAVAMLFVTASLGLTPILRAQTPVLPFEHLPDVSPWVFDVHQDYEGFLWIGSGEGLYRYDGHGFRRYAHILGDTTSLSGSNIKIIYEDRAGTLWIGTDLSDRGAGLNRYNRATDTFTRFVNDPNDPASLGASAVRAIHEDRAGVFWVGTDGGGLYRFDRETETFARHMYDSNDLGSLNENSISAIYEDRWGALWIGLRTYESDGSELTGLGRFDRERQRFTEFLHDPDNPASIGPGGAGAMLEDSKGRFWVGTSAGGLCRMNRAEGTFSCYRHDPEDPTSLSDDYISAIYEDASGSLWVGTRVFTGEGGLNRFNSESGTFDRLLHDPTMPNSLNGNNVETIHQDRSGVLWIGTFGGGLDKLKHPAPLFTTYRPPAPSLEAWSILEDVSGRLWVTSGVGIHRLDRRTGEWTSFLHDPDGSTSASRRDRNDKANLSRGTFRALYEDRSGVIWVGTGGGLDRFDEETGTFDHYRHDPGDPTTLSSNTVRSIYEDRQGRFWVGTWADGGLNLMDRATGRFTRFVHDPHDPASIGQGVVNGMLEDSKGRFWVATSAGGLNLMDRDKGRFTRFVNDPKDPNSLSGNDLNPLLEDAAGMLWVGTFGRGLNRFDPETGRARRFTTQNSCLPHDLVFGILQDERGFLWLNTNQGIVKFDPEQATCIVYGIDDGLVSLASVPGSFKTARGEFLFGSFGGVHGFFPEEIPGSAASPHVVLTNFRLFNRSVIPGPEGPLARRITGTDEIVLAHRQNSVGFEFAALHFTRPEQNQYAYQLEGFDEDWIQAGRQPAATYTNLPPGTYNFRVKAANADGIWNEDGASVRLVILPPWWRTGWAYAFYVLLFIAGIVAADRFQRRRLIRREREKARVRETELRTEALEAENRRKELELEKARELEALNAQLRAHEEQLTTQNRKLLEMNEMKGRFFANISHELRTPLTLILGPLKDVLRGEGEPRLSRGQFDAMARSAQHLLRLITQLLDLSRLEVGSMPLRARETDLVEFLRNTVLEFSANAEREKITLSFFAEEREIPLFFDPEKLEKVIFNLLSNALKFTPAGGKVRVTAALAGGQDGPPHAEVVVKDTGEGIPSEKLPFIFDRFYQADSSITRAREGTGIGLSLAKELVERHGGTISATSEVGFGTTFRVRLLLGKDHLRLDDIAVGEDAAEAPRGAASPLSYADYAPDKGLEEASAKTAEDIAPADAPLVLIVDDNTDVRAYVRGLLATDYRIVEARDGAEGLEAIRTSAPVLVIADVMMPEMDGFSLCRAVKTDPELSHIPVVLLTAKADSESTIEGLGSGADAYLSKPFEAEELLMWAENLITLRHMLRELYSGTVTIAPTEVVVSSAEAAFLERVRQVVEVRMGEPSFGVDELAAEVGLSPRQLQRRLRKSANISAAGFIRMMRLERGAQLLEKEAGLVSEVAYRVGFKNADHFSRLFHQVFGTTPSAYPPDRT